MSDMFRCELVSWKKVYALARRLAVMVKESGFVPDLIVAIARGGYVPARILCDYLDVTRLTSIQVRHYEAGAGRKKSASLAAPLAGDIHGLRVLLVDDVNDSGETLTLAVAHIRSLGPAGIRVAVLHQKQASPFSPDFYAGRIVKWRWLIYPWAVVEDIGGLIARMEQRPPSPDEAARVFVERFQCRVPKQVLADVYGLFQR